MSPEATDAPTDHLKKTSQATREAVLIKFLDKQAYIEGNAILKSDLVLIGAEEYAFSELRVDEAILEITKEDGQTYYYLCEDFKPQKQYRKEVVMGFSIPLLIFILALIFTGVGVILYEIIKALI